MDGMIRVCQRCAVFVGDLLAPIGRHRSGADLLQHAAPGVTVAQHLADANNVVEHDARLGVAFAVAVDAVLLHKGEHQFRVGQRLGVRAGSGDRERCGEGRDQHPPVL